MPNCVCAGKLRHGGKGGLRNIPQTLGHLGQVSGCYSVQDPAGAGAGLLGLLGGLGTNKWPVPAIPHSSATTAPKMLLIQPQNRGTGCRKRDLATSPHRETSTPNPRVFSPTLPHSPRSPLTPSFLLFILT